MEAAITALVALIGGGAALNNRLGSVVNNSLRAVLGRVPLKAVISDKREILFAIIAIPIINKAGIVIHKANNLTDELVNLSLGIKN